MRTPYDRDHTAHDSGGPASGHPRGPRNRGHPTSATAPTCTETTTYRMRPATTPDVDPVRTPRTPVP
ncbi:hypothetical protein D8M34_18415, partial [Microbacterium sp. HSID17254]